MVIFNWAHPSWSYLWAIRRCHWSSPLLVSCLCVLGVTSLSILSDVQVSYSLTLILAILPHSPHPPKDKLQCFLYKNRSSAKSPNFGYVNSQQWLLWTLSNVRLPIYCQHYWMSKVAVKFLLCRQLWACESKHTSMSMWVRQTIVLLQLMLIVLFAIFHSIRFSQF